MFQQDKIYTSHRHPILNAMVSKAEEAHTYIWKLHLQDDANAKALDETPVLQRQFHAETESEVDECAEALLKTADRILSAADRHLLRRGVIKRRMPVEKQLAEMKPILTTLLEDHFPEPEMYHADMEKYNLHFSTDQLNAQLDALLPAERKYVQPKPQTLAEACAPLDQLLAVLPANDLQRTYLNEARALLKKAEYLLDNATIDRENARGSTEHSRKHTQIAAQHIRESIDVLRAVINPDSKHNKKLKSWKNYLLQEEQRELAQECLDNLKEFATVAFGVNYTQIKSGHGIFR